MQAPVAPIKPYFDKKHNIEQADPYYWLRERDEEEVLAYLKAENDYADACTAHTKAFQDELYTEMVSRIKETDLSVPHIHGDYFYYNRMEKGKNYSIFCRKKGSLEAEEEILIDGNALAEGKAFFSLGGVELSDDHRFIAYSVDYNGSETYSIYIKDLHTGQTLQNEIPNTAGSLAWANDNQTLFYNVLDDAHRPYQIYRHHIKEEGPDTLIFEEADEAFFVYPFKMKDSSYLGIYLNSKITNEVHLLDANTPTEAFWCFRPRQKGIEYSVQHHEGYFYIRTNENALNFKFMRCADTAQTTDSSQWETFLAHDPEVMWKSMQTFEKHLVLSGRKEGFNALCVVDVSNNTKHFIRFPEPVYDVSLNENPEYHTTTLRFTYSSLISPRAVYDYDMHTKAQTLCKEYEVVGGYDKTQYHSERAYAQAPDGTAIPVSIVYKKDTPLDGSAPCLLYGYGSYGISSDPYFSTIRLSLLNRGFVCAIAHIRGGGEMGRAWYEAGKFLNKKNTFTDFIAAAEMLIQKQYTSSDHLAIRGGSAGGLLVGAVINMRPDLFKVANAAVPFVDVMNTMLDPTIPLTVIEYDEWGNPNESAFYEYMRSYSPYDNVKAQAYPHIIITAGLNDPRVQYWEPAKWTAKLRTLKTDNHTLILKTNMGAGHGGASGRYEAIKEIAFEYTFIMDKLGVLD